MTAPVPEPTGSPAQLCAQHRDRPSIATCPRCGRFACEECWGVRGLCRPCLLALASALPRTEPRARWATRFFILVAASQTAALTSNLMRLLGMSEEMPWTVDTVRVLPTLIGACGAAIAFLVWVHLLARHLQALRLDVSTTPASTVVWWFVPIAHLFMPYLVVRSLLRTLGGGALVRASAAVWWWATWIAGTSFTYLGKYATGWWFRILMIDIATRPAYFPRDELPVLRGQLEVALTAWEVFASCVLLIAAAFAARLVRSAERGLAAQRAALDVPPRAPVTAPAA